MSMLYSSESPGSILCSNSSLSGCALCPWMNGSMWIEESRTAILRRYAYGITLPAICSLGIVGNVLNLVVLTRRNMRGIAYIYMRGYSASALLAILFALPFAWRVLEHRDLGRWESSSLAFYHAHLELFLGNGCLGVGVIMLLALTLERYVFRALANLLEVTNYSITFYIYCMFSEDFRNTLLRTLQWSSGNLQTSGFSKATPPTATTTTTQHRSV
ncbi:probable G-protein coupled receptor B0563.6 isoform X2 [Photinus pyralis]|uniref:probable G-protein coupled receptor B0563.6 isoform X2 n=1 Tax=Photinus pyralis TaxID=7054 RepID=UPI001266E956|nr:probable G-protein coupled receptor B0563.6 isoform X2 [Photinus pyralis]